MKFFASNQTTPVAARPERRRGFSVVEVVVVVGLMSFIVLGLVMMFSQTQRAYKLGTSQVDVLEGGRATIDMIGRELSVITPSRISGTVNFYADLPFDGPITQILPGLPAVTRTNAIYDLYFLSKENQTWSGIGYAIGNRQAGVGTLYRYQMSARAPVSPQEMFNRFYFDYNDGGGSGPGTNKITVNLNQAIDAQLDLNISRLIDGVVHFRVRAYDTTGSWITNTVGITAPTNSIWLDYSTLIPGEMRYRAMYSNLVPATVELELGVLEDAVLAKARAIPDLTARTNYLAQQVSRVHLFRLRVPVRNVDPTAFQ